MSDERSLSELLWWMKSLAGKAPSEWARNFARSMLRQGKRPDWEPTPKQLRIMRQLVTEHLGGLNATEADDLQLIEMEG